MGILSSGLTSAGSAGMLGCHIDLSPLGGSICTFGKFFALVSPGQVLLEVEKGFEERNRER